MLGPIGPGRPSRSGRSHVSVVMSYMGASTAAVWGAVHLMPTRKIAAGFGPISEDNRNIITMEWIAEGAFLVFLGALVILVTAVDRRADAAQAVSVAAAVALVALAVVSLFTGFKIKFLPCRLCPAIFTDSAALILAGTLI